MDANQFVDLFEDEALLAKQDYQDLKSLVLRYPYCANLHLILLKKSVYENHPDLEKNLSRAAVTGIDRNSLRVQMRSWEEQIRIARGEDEWEETEEDELVNETPFANSGSTFEDHTEASSLPDADPVPQDTTQVSDVQAGADTDGPQSGTNAPYEGPEQELLPVEDDLNFQEGKIVRELAEESVSEHDEFISESLADLFAKQGNTEKAIAMYEKLSLKMPEKSDYFAAKIEDLKS